MKKIITALFVVFITAGAYAACTATFSYSCEAGYYLVGVNCYRWCLWQNRKFGSG